MSTEPKIRILLIIPNLGRGGAQQIFRQQLNHLSNTFEIFGCVFNLDQAFPDDHIENIFSLNVPAGESWLGKVSCFVLRIIRLRKLKRQKQIDISISHLEGADYVNILSKRTEKIICWIHGTKKHDENINGLMGILRMRVLMPWLYKKADRIVAVSKGIEFELFKHFKGINKLVQTIYNGFDIDKIIEQSKQPLDQNFIELFGQSKSIITHCRLSPQKNISALLLIYKSLSDRNDVKLIIVGDGELRADLISVCEQLGLKSWVCWNNQSFDLSCNVYFVGQQSNPFRFLRHASLYAMTSGWEGFPLALCEAMVCGLPVIASDCFTGPREIIAPDINLPQPLRSPYSNNHGVLMPLANVSNKESIDTWAGEVEKLISIADSDPIRNHPGVERINEFTISKSMTQTADLLNELSKR